MEIIKVAVISIAVAFLAIELKTYKPVWGILLSMAGTLFIILISVEKIWGILSGVQKLFEMLGDGAGYLEILLKVLGVTYLCQFASGICKDVGLGNLSDQIQIFGKIYIMLAGMPILLALIETIQQM